jgi:hypothetical protein
MDFPPHAGSNGVLSNAMGQIQLAMATSLHDMRLPMPSLPHHAWTVNKNREKNYKKKLSYQ